MKNGLAGIRCSVPLLSPTTKRFSCVCVCAVCACSTCHLILPHAIYDSLPEPSEDEEDMLDMAFGLSETSRLGCQVKVTTRMEGMVLEMPKATRNFYVDGHKPKPH
jgi:ferredoxin-2, mitochondrial